MCFAGGSSPQGDASTMGDPSSGAMQFRQGMDSGQFADAVAKARPANWNQMSPEEQQAWTSQMKGYYESAAKDQLGQDYIAPGQQRSANASPTAPDITDELLQKTRTNFALRLQAGKSTKSSFGSSSMGSLDLGGPILGGK